MQVRILPVLQKLKVMKKEKTYFDGVLVGLIQIKLDNIDVLVLKILN